MNRTYGTPVYCRYSSQRIEIRCYKVNRADGTYMVSIYSHFLSVYLQLIVFIPFLNFLQDLPVQP